MSKQIMTHLKLLEKAIKKNIGEEAWLLVHDQVKSIKENTRLDDVTKNVKIIISTLINNVDDKVFLKTMKDRGCDCALSRLSEIEKQKRDYKKNKSLDEYIDSLVEARTKGFYYYREDNKLYLVYRTKEYNLRCYCPLLRKLPDGDLIPSSHCECSRAFVQFT